jgi:bifunctional non-homologous end joining protein LigD
MSATVHAGRRDVEITRPDKPLFPSGITKADLARYYERVSGAMLPHIAGHPLNLERYPDGIDGHRIMQQSASDYFPDWIVRARVPKKGGHVDHVIAGDCATLVYLAGQACITPHAWLSRADRLERPDRMIIDLDPSGSDDPDAVRTAAISMGELLRELGLDPWVMTTGSRGYHLTTPLQRRASFDELRPFTRAIAELAAAREPDVFTTEQRKAKREGKILIDVMRNAYAHTAVAPYAVRARPDAPVATPLDWDELSDAATRPDRWRLRTVLDRLDRDGDPWREIRKRPQTIATARHRLDDALAEIRR